MGENESNTTILTEMYPTDGMGSIAVYHGKKARGTDKQNHYIPGI